jgi:cation diffusion facilitator family transporter
VVAAVFLTALKVVVGFSTGSLGILAEAVHSGFDLLAAGVTLWAVYRSSTPADSDHHYGHGKIESASALFETALLLLTCGWIVWEAVERLFAETVHVDASVPAFAVMLLSIIIDVSRSRALSAAAAKYDSRALEADALHFSTDVWSSLVVLMGLGGVAVANATGVAWLGRADTFAALGVAVLVVWVSIGLARRSLADLLDAVPAGVAERVARAAAVPGIEHVERVRVRRSGPETFVDLVVNAPSTMTFEDSHALTATVEAAVRQVVPHCDVLVHIEPTGSPAPPARSPDSDAPESATQESSA